MMLGRKYIPPFPIWLSLLLAFCLLGTGRGVGEEPFSEARGEEVRGFVEKHFLDQPNAMVIGLLDEAGSRVFGAGSLENGSDGVVDGDTLFELGSVTKVFTSLAMLELARTGVVKRDDPVSKYLPPDVQVPSFEGKEITLEHLAAQESGLPWHPNNGPAAAMDNVPLLERKRTFDAYTEAHLFDFLGVTELTAAPGSAFQYSNTGMALLAVALERASGKRYETLVREYIAQSLGMDDTRITLSADQKERLAMGHYYDGEIAENLHLQALAGAGSLISTTNDLLRFLSAHLGLSEATNLAPLLETMVELRHRGSSDFGKTAMPYYTKHVYQPPGSRLLGHGGGGFGYIAFIGMDLEKRRGVVVMSSQMNISAEVVGWTLLQDMPLTLENTVYLIRKVTGIGVALSKDEPSGLVRIARVFSHSPAAEAGLTAGLLIKEIDGIPLLGKPMSESLALTGGKKGTEAKIEVLDPETKESQTVVVGRDDFLTADW